MLLFSRATATGTITDNDEATLPVTATVNIADADPVAEGAGPARFTVSLSRAAGSDVVLDIAYAAGTASLADLGNPRPATVTIKTGATKATLDVPIFDDDMVEGTETFTVTLTVNTAPDGVTVADGVATGTIAATAEPSVLIEPRRIGAGTALRRHAGRFDTMTGTVVRNRLRGSIMKTLTLSENIGSGATAAGGQLGKTRWGSWIDGSWAGFGGKATGRQADVYGGFDFLGGNGKWLIGALAGHEMADLRIGKATYSASYTHLGLYGGVRLSDRLVFDGALTYGMATPEVTLGDVSASYDANRITARIALTGDFGLAYGLGTGSVKVEPQVGLLYSREALGAFTDSAGGVAGREVLELGRFSFGPRLTWDFDWGQVVGGARVQWDFLQLEDGVDGRLSGAADIGLRFGIAPGVTLGVHGDVDGIGISEEFGSLGGKVELKARF